MRRHQVRTTLQLDDDVLAAARVLARQQRTSLGAVVNALARLGLLPWMDKGAPVDLDLVNQLRDDLA